MTYDEQGRWLPYDLLLGRSNLVEAYAALEAGEPLANLSWWWRHDGRRTSMDEQDDRFRCACPGSPEVPSCVQRASQEDRLCDACRRHCWGQTDDGKPVSFIGAYGPAADR